MLGAAARFLPAIRNFTRQIIPPVVATLLAAVLIAGYNRAFTGHLVQPRMGMLHGDVVGTDEAPRPAGMPATAKAREVTDAVVITEPASPHERIYGKDDGSEAAKDQAALKIAAPAPVTAPAPVVAPAPVIEATPAAVPAAPTAPPVVRNVAKKVEPRVVEQRPLETRPAPAPVFAAPPRVIATAPIAAPGPMAQPPVAQEPPAVIAGKPMVTVPDRQRAPYAANSPYEAAPAPEQQDFAPPPPAQGPLERFVETVKPSSIFARMRELGERIEAAGNDILPSIRQ